MAQVAAEDDPTDDRDERDGVLEARAILGRSRVHEHEEERRGHDRRQIGRASCRERVS